MHSRITASQEGAHVYRKSIEKHACMHIPLHTYSTQHIMIYCIDKHMPYPSQIYTHTVRIPTHAGTHMYTDRRAGQVNIEQLCVKKHTIYHTVQRTSTGTCCHRGKDGVKHIHTQFYYMHQSVLTWGSTGGPSVPGRGLLSSPRPIT